MTKKILSVIVCIAMLLSSLSIMSYAADIIIDLGPLFEDDATAPDNNGTTDDKKDDSSDDDKKQDNTNKDDTTKPSDSKDDTKPEDGEKDEQKPADDKPAPDGTWTSNPFKDVSSKDWFYKTVEFVTENKIFNGITDDTFVPNAPLTRAMLVTVLYRVAGSPEVSGEIAFSDVKSGDWYGNAVLWASTNGIVTGIDEYTFAPSANITREQIAAIIYRYAKFVGKDVSVGESTSIESYSDAGSVSKYAKDAVQYTVGSGIMTGVTATELQPKANATRAQAATIITRLIQK